MYILKLQDNFINIYMIIINFKERKFNINDIFSTNIPLAI